MNARPSARGVKVSPEAQPRPTHGITFRIGPIGISLCVRRWVVGGAIGLRKQLGQ